MSQWKSVVGAGLVGFLAVAVTTPGLAAQAPEDAAQPRAEAWLAQVDGGDYAGSWEQAARALKAAVKQADWSQMVEAMRGPLGGVASRKLRSREYKESMPPTTRTIGGRVYTWSGGGPSVVLEYDTSFANKASAVETVVATRDADGAWRVSSYSVR